MRASSLLLISIALLLGTPLSGCTLLGRQNPSGITTGVAHVNGTSLYYEVRGRGHPVVLLQGGNMDLRMWDEQFEDFAKHYRVIRYDVRGFGRSGPRGASYRALDDLRALLDHLGIQRAHLVGLSLGGRIALDFALEHPSRVGALVLAGPGLSGFAWSTSSNEWFLPMRDAILAGDSVRAAELWLLSPYMAPAMESPRIASRLRHLALENSRVFVHRDTEQPLSPPAVQRLDQVRAPTLVLLGNRDVPDIHRIVDLLAAGVPEARRVVFEGAGHMLNLERPQEFNRTVLEFLSHN